MNNKNIETIQQIYADFGAGNVTGILNKIADDVLWIDAGYPDVPWASNGRTKKQIPEFFKSLAENIAYTKFEPCEFFSDGNAVIVKGYHEGNTIPRNKHVGHEWVMVWKFNDAGNVNYYRAFIDTDEMAKGFRD